MTIAPTTSPVAPLVERRAYRLDVDHLLGTDQHDTVLAWLEAAVDMTRPVRVGVEIAPYAGSPEVVWLDGTATAPVTAAPVATVHQMPTRPTATATTDEPAPVTRLALSDRFVKVRLDAIQSLSTDDAVMLARLLHFQTPQRDIAAPVTVLEAALGIKRRSIKTVTTDGDRLGGLVALRYKTDGRQDVYRDSNGAPFWRFDVAHRVNLTTGSNGSKTLADKTDRFVSVPLSWLFTEDAAGNLTATTYAPSTILAAIITRAWVGNRQGGAEASLTRLAAFGQVPSRSKFALWWGAAEDAGLVYATRSDFGGTARRFTHAIPLKGAQPTTRQAAVKKDRPEVVGFSDTDPETPF